MRVMINDDIGIGVVRLENRKRPSLVIITKKEVRVVASFQGESAALAFEDQLRRIFAAVNGRGAT